MIDKIFRAFNPIELLESKHAVVGIIVGALVCNAFNRGFLDGVIAIVVCIPLARYFLSLDKPQASLQAKPEDSED